jgi:hypothetical protein
LVFFSWAVGGACAGTTLRSSTKIGVPGSGCRAVHLSVTEMPVPEIVPAIEVVFASIESLPASAMGASVAERSRDPRFLMKSMRFRLDVSARSEPVFVRFPWNSH